MLIEAWWQVKSQIERLKGKSSFEYLRRTSYLWRCWLIKSQYSNLLAENVLDIGCSFGLLSFFLHSSKYVGMDLSKSQIKEASRLNKAAQFLVGDAIRIPIRDCTVNTIVASELLEYLDEPEKFLQEVKRILRLGGHIILVAYNAWSLFPLFQKMRSYSLKHVSTSKEILALIGKQKFRMVEYQGLEIYEIVMNLIKTLVARSPLEVLKFEERFFYLRLIDFMLARKTRILAYKHIYVAKKVA